MRIALAVVPLLAAIGAYAQTPAAPSYLEFSTYFQIRANAIDNAFGALTSAGANGEFYVAGDLAADDASLRAFPRQPANGYPTFFFSDVSFVARFSGAGQLIDWRLLWNPLAPSGFSPVALLTDVPDRVAVVSTSAVAALPEPATDGAFLAANGGASLLVLSADLRSVLVSTFVTPPNSNIFHAALDRDGSLVYTGASSPAFGKDGTTSGSSQFGFPYLARLSADGRSLLQVQPVGASRIALAQDGSVWLGISTANATLSVAGASSRPYTGSNLATWSPAGGDWTSYLSPEITASGFPMTVQGNPNRPGQFFATDGISLFRSRDGGATWEVLPGFPAGGPVWCAADPRRLYAWRTTTVSVSSDEGETWSTLPDVLARGLTAISHVVVSPSNADLVAVRADPTGISYVSADGGKNWQPVIDPPNDSGRFLVPRLAIEGADEPRLIWMERSTGIQAHDAAGWHRLGDLPPNANTSASPRYYPGSPPVIAIDSLSFGQAVSTDYGASWREIDVCGFAEGPCSLWVNPADSNEWWVTGSRAWRSTDGGQSWTVIREDLGPGRVTSLAFSGANRPIVAATAPMRDVYLRKLDPSWSETTLATYLGGSFDESLAALLVDSTGRLNVVAGTSSADYPTSPDALQTGVVGTGVGLTRFSPSADAIEYSSTWGGQLTSLLARARLAVGDRVIWCGTTNSSNPPNLAEPLGEPLAAFTTNAFAGGYDPAAAAWLPTYLFGGQGSTATRDCAVTPESRIALVGATDSAAFPLAGAGLPPLAGTRNRMFVSLIRQFQGGTDEKQRHPKQPPHLPDHGGARRPRRVR